MDTTGTFSRTVAVSRLQWTLSLEKSLVELKVKYPDAPWSEIRERWRGEFPSLDCSSGALRTRYCRIRKRNVPIAGQTEGAGDSPGRAGEPLTASSEPPVSPPSGRGSLEAAVEHVSENETNELEEIDELREEFRTILREVERGEEGSFGGRKRPACQGLKVNGELIELVDDLITEFYQMGKTMWRLNCLVYAGAVLVEKIARKSLARPGADKGAKARAVQVKGEQIALLRQKVGWR